MLLDDSQTKKGILVITVQEINAHEQLKLETTLIVKTNHRTP